MNFADTLQLFFFSPQKIKRKSGKMERLVSPLSVVGVHEYASCYTSCDIEFDRLTIQILFSNISYRLS